MVPDEPDAAVACVVEAIVNGAATTSAAVTATVARRTWLLVDFDMESPSQRGAGPPVTRTNYLAGCLSTASSSPQGRGYALPSSFVCGAIPSSRRIVGVMSTERIAAVGFAPAFTPAPENTIGICCTDFWAPPWSPFTP